MHTEVPLGNHPPPPLKGLLSIGLQETLAAIKRQSRVVHLSGRANTKGVGVMGSTNAGVGVGLSFSLEVFKQVEGMLPEFSSFDFAVGRLLQDFQMAAAGLQVEYAFIQTQRIILEELLVRGERQCLGLP